MINGGHCLEMGIHQSPQNLDEVIFKAQNHHRHGLLMALCHILSEKFNNI
jgi:hypothetical protein